jgi:hypothetical protein
MKSRVKYPHSRLRIICLGISTGSTINEIQIPGSDGPLIYSTCTRSLACMLQGPSSASNSPAFPVGVDACSGGGGVATDCLYLCITKLQATLGTGVNGTVITVCSPVPCKQDLAYYLPKQKTTYKIMTFLNGTETLCNCVFKLTDTLLILTAST